MKRSHLSRLVWPFLSTAALLSACGGGGGGGDDTSASAASAPPPPPAVAVTDPDGSATPVATPASSPALTAPDATVTGLTAPTRKLSLDGHDAVLLAKQTFDAGNRAAGALAALGLAPLDAVAHGATSAVACPDAGTVSAADSGQDQQIYTFNGCKAGSFAYTGTATMQSTVDAGVRKSFTLTFSNLQVASNDSPPTINGSLSCVPAANASDPPLCTADFSNFIWGADLHRGAQGQVEGSQQCKCTDGTWNVTFNDFTATGGGALAVSSDGQAIVTRTGEKTFQTVATVGGNTQAFEVTLN